MPPKRIKPEQRLDFRLTAQERDLRFTNKEALPGVAVEEARPFTVKQGQYLAFIYFQDVGSVSPNQASRSGFQADA
jgi:hypothetical protein